MMHQEIKTLHFQNLTQSFSFQCPNHCTMKNNTGHLIPSDGFTTQSSQEPTTLPNDIYIYIT